MALWTAVDAGACAAEELVAPDGGLSAAFRCLLQLLDDYERAVRQGGTSTASKLFAEAPSPTGDSRVDAALAPPDRQWHRQASQGTRTVARL